MMEYVSLPTHVKVGPMIMVIERPDMLRSIQDMHWGCFKAVEQVIEIQKDFPCPGKMLDTVLHELMHAIYYAYSIADEDDEEATVTKMATGFAALLADNPQLSAWIRMMADDAGDLPPPPISDQHFGDDHDPVTPLPETARLWGDI